MKDENKVTRSHAAWRVTTSFLLRDRGDQFAVDVMSIKFLALPFYTLITSTSSFTAPADF